MTEKEHVATELVESAEYREDGWRSLVTGMGQEGVDKRESVESTNISVLPPGTLNNIFHNDDIAYRAVSSLPEDALSMGIEFVVSEESGGQDASTKLLKEASRLKLVPRVLRAAIMGRLYGGAALWIGVRGSGGNERPLDPSKVKKVVFLKVIDKRYLTPDWESEDTDPYSETYGEPLRWKVRGRLPGDKKNTVANGTIIHSSRLVFFGGAYTDDEIREQNEWWDLSILQRMYPILRDHGGAWGSISSRLSEGAFTLMTIDDLAKKMAAGQEGAIKNRVRMLNYGRSVARTVLIDSKETYERQFDSLTGVKDTLAMFMMRVSAAVPMPVTRLFMKSAEGMNATGEGDDNIWTAQVRAYRTQVLEPCIEFIMNLVSVADEGSLDVGIENWSVKWPELEPLNDKERAEVYAKVANGDKVYIDGQAVTPAEFAAGRFRPEGYNSGNVQLDLKIRKTIAELELERLQQEPETPEEGGDDPGADGDDPGADENQPPTEE